MVEFLHSESHCAGASGRSEDLVPRAFSCFGIMAVAVLDKRLEEHEGTVQLNPFHDLTSQKVLQ